MKPRISIIAPAFNEADTLPEFHRRVAETMAAIGESWELVIVDDGSKDSTAGKIRTSDR